MDKTLILVKPDAFARNLTGEIIARFERKGLRIVALKYMQMDEAAVIRAVHPNKDVDCFHPENVGLLAAGHPRFLPCTPLGVQQMLALLFGAGDAHRDRLRRAVREGAFGAVPGPFPRIARAREPRLSDTFADFTRAAQGPVDALEDAPST